MNNDNYYNKNNSNNDGNLIEKFVNAMEKNRTIENFIVDMNIIYQIRNELQYQDMKRLVKSFRRLGRGTLRYQLSKQIESKKDISQHEMHQQRQQRIISAINPGVLIGNEMKEIRIDEDIVYFNSSFIH